MYRGLDPMQLPRELHDVLQDELRADESIEWMAQPLPGRYALPALPIVLFAIPWTGFAVFWIFGAAGFKMPTWQGPQSLFPLLGLPFVLIGIGMLTSPLWFRRRARRTVYAVTDQRALIVMLGRSATIHSIEPERLASVQKTVRADGSGSLMFAAGLPPLVVSAGGSKIAAAGFVAIADVRGAEEAIRRLTGDGIR